MKNAARSLLVSLAVLLAACASSSSSTPAADKAAVPEPKLTIVQLSDVGLAAQHVTGGLSVKYALQVHNVASEPITLRHLELQSIGYGAYTLRPQSQNFDAAVAPDQTIAVEFWMPAQIVDASIAGANGPVTLRGQAQFQSAKGMFQTTWTQQVHEGGDVSGGH